VSRAERRSRRTPAWARDTDARLLRRRFRDLHLGPPQRALLRRAITRLHRELEAAGIRLQPHVWFSEEWFSPDGVPGIAIPFYLAHPRLERLERRMARTVEGGNSTSLLRILRHEVGHAVDTAYRLRRRKLWRDTFGPPRAPYPDRYVVDTGSRDYVQHLDGWYAQAHPAEDFAETFAVWLSPRSAWRKRYADWPARVKLEAMQTMMESIRERDPLVRSATRIESVAANELTLGEYYRQILARRAHCDFSAVDRLLGRAFAGKPHVGRARRADAFLRGLRAEFIDWAVGQTGVDAYSAGQLVDLAIERCRERQLWLKGSRPECVQHARAMVLRLARAGRRGIKVGFAL
jgi:hypothetical protein